mmetsp:Transcript_2274/g.4038  ORF Transcript_2274/g.4038 Transcript_2274/m.4038 type:complete len:407 (-) Transcript_2274:940-2160(-)
MSLDFVQLRWQQIRAAEAAMVVENENIALKKEIAELKKSHTENLAKLSASQGIDKLVIAKHCQYLRTFAMRTNSELIKLKITYGQEVSGLVSQKELMGKAFENVLAILKMKEAQNEALEMEKVELVEQLKGLHLSNSSHKHSHSQEMDRLKQKFQEMKDDLKDAQSKQQSLIKENDTLERKIETLANEKTESSARYQALHVEHQRMQGIVEKLRLEQETALEDVYQEKQRMQSHYEQIIEQLGYENEYLRNTCAEQEEQIAKLTNSLIGNKSHFAKYVEVKTENLSLQSKLQSMSEKSKPRNNNNSIRSDANGGGGGNVAGIGTTTTTNVRPRGGRGTTTSSSSSSSSTRAGAGSSLLSNLNGNCTTSSSSGGSQLTVYIVVHHQDNALNATVPAAVGTVPLAEAF